ncbi:MAG: helix-turn-helix transcriptional regulator [Paramuribaculum sp.]|nr:helix-turn-helix transcriptional regulator [Paramuribaculum sp.]
MNCLPIEENLKKYTCIANCPIRNVISRFSGKWSLLILYILSENSSTRFNAIGRAIPDISPKVLSATLKTLETDRLITRKLYAEIPPRVEYSLTEKGRSLMPILHSLMEWATKHT